MSGITWRPTGVRTTSPAWSRWRHGSASRLGLTRGINLAAMEHQFAHLVNSDPLTDCLVAERDGVTTGYTRTEWHDLVEGDRIHDITAVVDPDAWGLGIAATSLLAWSEGRLRVIARTHPRDRRCWYTAYAYDGDDESVARAGRVAATRPCAGTPRCSGRTSSAPPAVRAAGRIRVPDRRRRTSCPRSSS